MAYQTQKAIEIELDATIQADRYRHRSIWKINNLFQNGTIDSYALLFKTILSNVVEPANRQYNETDAKKSFSRHIELLVAENYAKHIQENRLLDKTKEKVKPEWLDSMDDKWFLSP